MTTPKTKKWRGVMILLLVISLALVVCTACSGKSGAATVFYISGIPDQNKSDTNNAFIELASILSEATGLDVRYREVFDYAAVVSGFARGEIHLAWFGGLTGVQGRALLDGSVAVVHRIEDTGFTSVFIAGANTDIHSLEDIRGHSFTFGSESSTSGHLMPRYFLSRAGLNPEADFAGVIGYSGSHDRTIELVSNGAFDSGALNDLVWDRYVREGLIDMNRVRFLMYTPEYFNYNFSMPSKESVDATFGNGMFDLIVETILNIDVRNNAMMYPFFVSEGFLPTNNENYDDLKEVATMLGLLMEQ